MKKKNLILIAVAVAVAIAAAVIAIVGSRSTTIEQDYHIADTGSITKVFLADKENGHVLLQRVDSTHWVVDSVLPANQPLVDLLLETLREMRIRQQVNKNAIPNTIKDLSAHGIKVEVYQRVYRINWFGGSIRLFPHEKRTVTYYVGRETQDMMGSCMFRKGDKVPYIIHIPGFRGFLTPRFVTDPLKWRSHTVVSLNVRQIQRVELEIPAMQEESFAIVSNGQGFDFEKLSTHQRMNGFDTARVAQMLASFNNLCFDEFAAIVPNTFADSCVAGTPKAILRVTDTAGVTTELKSYIKYTNPADLQNMPDTNMYETFDLNRLYAVVSGGSDRKSANASGNDTVLIQYFIFDNILQPASYFLGADKSAFAK